MVCAPCGSGKTLLSLELTRRTLHRGGRVLHLIPRRELIDQLCVKLDEWMPGNYGVIASKTKRRVSAYAPIQVGSIDTLVSRVIRKGRDHVPLADLVLVDEAHLMQTNNRLALMEMFPDARIGLFTATPCRFDGRAMGSVADELIEIATVRQLIAKGHLVKPQYYTPSSPDLKRMVKVAGDYNKTQAGERMEPLLGNIVEHWLEKNSDRVTVVYANSRGQSAWLAQEFRKHGICAEHCDGGYEDTARDEIMGRFRNGETQVLCNVDLVTYGFDLPELSCAVLARPTLSESRYIQMGGRPMRAFRGKTDCVIQDHSGCVRQHGYIEEERIWCLEGKRDIKHKLRLVQRSGERKDPELKIECPDCHLVFAGGLRCTNCGFYYERLAKKFHVVEGRLVKIGGDEPAIDNTSKIQFYRELLGYCQQVGYKLGWAAHAYESKHKTMPPREWAQLGPLAPSQMTNGYIKFLRIRRAKARQKGVARES